MWRFADGIYMITVAVGPYFPKRGQRPIGPKSNIRPPRPQFQMFLHSNQLEAAKVSINSSVDTGSFHPNVVQPYCNFSCKLFQKRTGSGKKQETTHKIYICNCTGHHRKSNMLDSKKPK